MFDYGFKVEKYSLNDQNLFCSQNHNQFHSNLVHNYSQSFDFFYFL